MNSLKYLMTALAMLSFIASNAQIKNAKTESVKIYGNCGMCETTIEKAGTKTQKLRPLHTMKKRPIKTKS